MRESRSETGWDLGPFAAVLQCLHLDKPLLQQQNTKKLYGTKNNSVHAQLGQILRKKIQKDSKTELPPLKSREQKQGIRNKSRVLCMPAACTPLEGWAEHLSRPSSPTPEYTPTLTPYKEPARPALGSEQGNLLLVFTPSCDCRGPNKALPEFLVWSLVNFY